MKNTACEEEAIYTYIHKSYMPGPLWNYGTPNIIRKGNDLYISVLEADLESPSLCNARWKILKKQSSTHEWSVFDESLTFSEREPCPIAHLEDHIIISENIPDSIRYITENKKTAHFCTPYLKIISLVSKESKTIKPEWNDTYLFTEHSYRGIGTDKANKTILLFHINAYVGYAWSLIGLDGTQLKYGHIPFPMRGAYPQIAINDNKAAILCVSDVFEPNYAWRKFKAARYNKSWDYTFRQLYFSYTENIIRNQFSPVLTIASVDETGGHIANQDLWIDKDGIAHILYIQRNVWKNAIRNEFFSNIPIKMSLNYCQVSEGNIIHRRTLLEITETNNDSEMKTPYDTFVPNCARFHSTNGHDLHVIYHASTANEEHIFYKKVFPTSSEKTEILHCNIPLQSFVAASPRNGTDPSHIVDLLGTSPGWKYEDVPTPIKDNIENDASDNQRIELRHCKCYVGENDGC